jgi:hypothetical protein
VHLHARNAEDGLQRTITECTEVHDGRTTIARLVSPSGSKQPRPLLGFFLQATSIARSVAAGDSIHPRRRRRRL